MDFREEKVKSFKHYIEEKNINIESKMIYVYLEHLYNLGAFPFINMEACVSFLNTLPSNERLLLTELGKSYGIGDGEHILYILCKDAVLHKEFDLEVNNVLYEIKKGNPVLSGGTNKAILTDLITVFNMLDKYFALYPTNKHAMKWFETYKHSWSNLTIEQITYLFAIYIPYIKYTSYHAKSNEVKYILNFIKSNNISPQSLEEQLKNNFLNKIDYIIHIDKHFKYNIISADNFKTQWKFDGITRGNRVRFKM